MPTHFDVVQPESLDEALGLLAEHGDQALLIAGGTDLMRDIRIGVAAPTILVSLDRIGALAGIYDSSTPGGLEIGPLTTMAVLARDQRVHDRLTALAEGAAWMGSPQVRNRATYGGNLCNARPCADSAPGTIVLDAQLVLQRRGGSRTVPAAEFMIAPGQTMREPDEILTTIRYEALPEHTGSAFATVTNRRAMEITITSSSARLTLESADGPVTAARICLGSVAPKPVGAPTAEALLVGSVADQALLEKAAQAAVSDCTPIDDQRGSAQYRRWMVQTLTRRALQAALARAQGGHAGEEVAS